MASVEGGALCWPKFCVLLLVDLRLDIYGTSKVEESMAPHPPILLKRWAMLSRRPRLDFFLPSRILSGSRSLRLRMSAFLETGCFYSKGKAKGSPP